MWGANDVLDLGEGKSALGPASSFSQHQRPALALAMRPMASACSLCRICIHCDCVQRGGPGLQQSGQSQGTRIRESRAASGACIRPLLRLLSALFTRLTIAVQSRRSCHVGLWSLHLTDRHQSSRLPPQASPPAPFTAPSPGDARQATTQYTDHAARRSRSSGPACAEHFGEQAPPAAATYPTREPAAPQPAHYLLPPSPRPRAPLAHNRGRPLYCPQGCSS